MAEQSNEPLRYLNLLAFPINNFDCVKIIQNVLFFTLHTLAFNEHYFLFSVIAVIIIVT